ncbi:MAG: helix-turn-helix domain-containing protein [Eubacterium sp.]|nr:helix-turn-helix domain-containing protein [Eubacterium sp.]
MYHFTNNEELKQFIADNIISTGETAELLGCSRQYINQLIKENKLIPIKKINYITLFLKSDVEARLK